jgi:glycosyltransferase involved in cell wall biosynthesis
MTMRLAVVVSHPIQYFSPLFRALSKMVELDVFYAHRASMADQAAAGFGVEFDWDTDLLSGHRHVFLNNVSRSPGTSHFFGCDTPEIGSWLAKGNYTAVLVMGWHLKTFWQAIFAARLHGLPVMVRGDSQLATPRSAAKIFAKRLLYPFGLRAFYAALYTGQRSREYFEHYGYPRERLFFSPHCVDSKWFGERATPGAREKLRSRLGVDPNETLVLFAGKLLEFKRPLDLVAAAARLRGADKAVGILVAGAGPLEGAMRREACLAKVPSHFLGFQNQTDMPSAYAASDLLVLPSTGRETWGLVANEALACRRPIVVSDAVGCAPDLAADGSAGRVYPMGDCERLAEAIGDIIAMPPGRDAITRKSEAFSIEVVCSGIVEALRCRGAAQL